MVAIGLRKREPRRAADGLRQEGQVGSGRETYEEVSGGGGGGGRRLIEMPPSHLARRRSSAVKLSFLSYISSLPPFLLFIIPLSLSFDFSTRGMLCQRWASDLVL